MNDLQSFFVGVAGRHRPMSGGCGRMHRLGDPAGVVRARESEDSDRPFGRLPRRSRQLTTILRMLVQLRVDAGLNQTSLAYRLGITQSEVSKYERGERVLDVLRLRDWLRALEVEFAPFAHAVDQELQRQDFFGA